VGGRKILSELRRARNADTRRPIMQIAARTLDDIIKDHQRPLRGASHLLAGALHTLTIFFITKKPEYPNPT
jgi:hypothetical protein